MDMPSRAEMEEEATRRLASLRWVFFTRRRSRRVGTLACVEGGGVAVDGGPEAGTCASEESCRRILRLRLRLRVRVDAGAGAEAMRRSRLLRCDMLAACNAASAAADATMFCWYCYGIACGGVELTFIGSCLCVSLPLLLRRRKKPKERLSCLPNQGHVPLSCRLFVGAGAGACAALARVNRAAPSEVRRNPTWQTDRHGAPQAAQLRQDPGVRSDEATINPNE